MLSVLKSILLWPLHFHRLTFLGLPDVIIACAWRQSSAQRHWSESEGALRPPLQPLVCQAGVSAAEQFHSPFLCGNRWDPHNTALFFTRPLVSLIVSTAWKRHFCFRSRGTSVSLTLEPAAIMLWKPQIPTISFQTHSPLSGHFNLRPHTRCLSA